MSKEAIATAVVVLFIIFGISHQLDQTTIELNKMSIMYDELKREYDALYEIYGYKNDCVFKYEGETILTWR